MQAQFTDDQIRDAIVGLVGDRPAQATICPSEAARALSPLAWRPLMPRIRGVAVAMAKRGELEIRSGGLAIAPDLLPRGPIRLGRPRVAPGTSPDRP